MKLGRERALRVAARLVILTALAGGATAIGFAQTPPSSAATGPSLKPASDDSRAKSAGSEEPASTPASSTAKPAVGPKAGAVVDGARAPAVETPQVARAASAPSGSIKPASSTEVSVDERLRRMEEAYLRMEESNRRIQEQYSTLLQQYQDLSKTLRRSVVKDPTSKSPEKAPDDGVESLGFPGFPGLEDEAGDDPDRITFLQQSGVGAQGRLGRGGQPGGADLPEALPGQTPPGATGPGASFEGARARPGGVDEFGGRSRADRIGVGAEGTGGRVSPTQQPTRPGATAGEAEVWVYKPDAGPPTRRATVRFGEGLEFATDDDEYRLQFHNLTQVDYRGFPTKNQGILQSQFFIPRERWYFTGNLTKNVGYYTVINRGYGTLDLLDAFISLRVDDRLRLRVGRMKTPYLYEYFSIAEGDLIAPERSLFADNMGLNRQIGMLFLGNLFDDRLSYATGVFNGPRNSFGAFDSSKDWIGTITTRPFLTTNNLPALRYLNLGGSWDTGYQSNTPPQPTYFETANDQTGGTGAQSVSPTFLALNKNVIEQGERAQWAAHAVWFYKSFFLMAEYGGGRAGYGFSGSKYSTPVNYNGWFVQASYMLTGEELTRRVSVLQPRRDFNFDWFKGGEFRPGAVELQARYSTMSLGQNIFTAGLADPALYTNHVWATDMGINWYLNFYVKIQLDWQHAGFGNLVTMGPDKFASTADIYWLRFQLFF
jgi:phosphate-selective porin OprO/OprP